MNERNSQPGPPESDSALARLEDACLNRATEALRVVEDICRFAWNLPGPSRDLKALRHELLETFTPTAADRIELVLSRDIEGDVGRVAPASTEADARPARAESTGSSAELDRAAVRNFERLKQSLRSLAEVCRDRRPRVFRQLEELRYRVYSIEKGVLQLARKREAGIMASVRLYWIWSGAPSGVRGFEILEGALAGGIDAVQMREKDLDDRKRLEIGRELRSMTAAAGVPFIVNDRPDLARALHADGVHLGQDDLPLAEARRILGRDSVIGVSAHSVEQAARAWREGADYIGIGPVHATTTKKRAGSPLDPETIRTVFGESTGPAFAIGGIDTGNLESLVELGVDRIAISSAIATSKNGTEAKEIASRLASLLGSQATEKAKD